MSKIEIIAIIEKAEEGGYIAYCPALKGCYSQGETLEEVEKNIKEAALGWLEAKAKIEERKAVEKVLQKAESKKVPSNGHRKLSIKISPQLVLAGI